MYKFFSVVTQNEQFFILIYFEFIIYLFLFLSKSNELIYAYIVSRIQYMTILMLSIPLMLGLDYVVPFHPIYMITEKMQVQYYFPSLLIRSIQLLLCFLFRPILKKAFLYLAKIPYRYLLLIFITLTMILPFYDMTSGNNPYTSDYLRHHLSHITMLLVTLYLLILLYYNLSYIRSSNTEAKKRAALVQFQEDYLDNVSRIMKQTAKFRHDISNQILVLEKNINHTMPEENQTWNYYERLQLDWSNILVEFENLTKLTPNSRDTKKASTNFLRRLQLFFKEETAIVSTIFILITVILTLHIYNAKLLYSLLFLFTTLILLIYINMAQIKSINLNAVKKQLRNETYTSIQRDMYIIENLFSSVQNQLSFLEKRNEKNLMAQMLHQYDQTFLRFQTHSSILNTLFLIKDQQCKKKSIEFRCNFSLSKQYLSIEYELCKLLMNLLDNAIDACSSSNALAPSIQLALFQKMNFISLSVINSKSIDQKPLLNSMQSTKNSPEHGLGMEIIHEIVTSLHGTIEMKDHGTIFFTKIILQLPN